jgi:preprotein translocase subunit SecA
VLVGTASVEDSERLAAVLRGRGLVCAVLNARNDEEEASVVARAGWLGAVTISTNMAGRGTDIRLGRDDSERDQVLALGGLYVLGTHRHDSVRIDDQLRGRAGRQGDPGTSRFFISLDDDLMVRHGIHDLIPRGHLPEPQDDPVEDPIVLREIDRVQRIVEGQSFDIRRTLFKYSSIVEGQRELVAARRADALVGATGILAATAPQRYQELLATAGDTGIRLAERQVSLALLDELWADHLARVADIREGIHLHALAGTSPFGAGQDPLVAFHRAVADAFGLAWGGLDDDIVTRLLTAHVTSQGVDLEREGLDVPASTWTYIINDDPFGDLAQRVASRLRNKVAGMRRSSHQAGSDL